MDFTALIPAGPVRELARIATIMARMGYIEVPRAVIKASLSGTNLEPWWRLSSRQADIVGDLLIDCVNELGPLYGKAGQMALSRLTAENQAIAEKWHLTRLYSDWPALPGRAIEGLLDKEIPGWRDHFVLDKKPLGVASMAQVHGIRDMQGREWVVKILKPQAKQRLTETVEAIEKILQLTDNIPLNHAWRRDSRELWEMCRGLRREMSLDLERANIDRIRQILAQKKSSTLRIPETWDQLCTPQVLVMERFRGMTLADIVRGHVKLSAQKRKVLAKKTLTDILLQIFELGVFHGDPHGGNLILLDDGQVGLVDWGLTGELLESDRKQIAALLRALLTLNFEQLVETLVDMSAHTHEGPQRDHVTEKLRSFGRELIERQKGGEALSFPQVLNEALVLAEELALEIPSGLLMMAKSLVTIEGLAKGIDPDVALARIATPVLWRASQPRGEECMALGKKIPKLARHWLMQVAR